ncbi:hypothetical protein K7432_017678 [Basidiobolus ranarum]|uniref:Carrier domain-containing protein n=1 Tax=Basidiobolus ranarum TaxID=34480 RepID=A0ABR2WD42_9FUNG
MRLLLNPVPIGFVGELCVAGDGLARGYLNRPELTAERFVINPNPECNGERIYRTGDLARYRSDGNLEFVGRIDHQVKIRGFRIELGEIENVLLQQDSIRECVVVVRDGPSGEKQLVSYIVTDDDSDAGLNLRNEEESGIIVDEPFVSHLRELLHTLLPKYMVPSAIIVLDSMPLMPNGKINRGALPVLSSSQRKERDGFLGQGTKLQRTIRDIFVEVLGFEQVSIHDNFFDLGGHSLSATKVISRIRVVLNQEVPLIILFEAPTAVTLSSKIEAMTSEFGGNSTVVPRIMRVVDRVHMPLSFAQERLWFMNELIPNSPFYNIPLALRLVGQLNVNILKQCIVDIVARHEALRTSFVLSGNEPIQFIESIEKFPSSFIEYCDLTQQPGEVKSMIAQESRRPFDLAKSPLIKVKLVHLKPEEHVLLIVIHHIVSDGWSITILQKELAVLYESYSCGKSSPLPEPLIQYADFAVWQRNWLQGDNLDRQMTYWKEKLRDLRPLTLPLDFIRPSVLSYCAKFKHLEFTSTITNQLKELSKMESSTLKTLPSALLLLIVIVKR